MTVFLVPGLLKHLKRSVTEGVRLQEMGPLDDPSLLDRLRKEYGDSPVKLWAVKETLTGYWRKCGPGDLLLFYNGGRFLHSAEVAFTYPSADEHRQLPVASRVAENVWGRDVDGRTWPYLIFLKNVREILLPLEEFNRAFGYKYKAVAGFTVAKRVRTEDLLKLLRVPPPKIKLAPEELKHDQIADLVADLGQLIGYQAEKKWRYEGYEFDVAWFRKPRVGPKCVFEIQLKGSIEAALTKLKHAHDLWESTPFLISTPEQLEKLGKYLEGAFHELEDALVPVKINEIEEFYEFKGKYEWLERKFGLKPR
jgi:hypothetical protein